MSPRQLNRLAGLEWQVKVHRVAYGERCPILAASARRPAIQIRMIDSHSMCLCAQTLSQSLYPPFYLSIWLASFPSAAQPACLWLAFFTWLCVLCARCAIRALR